MRFYTKVHEAYCGIDLHARTMYVCILNQDGEIGVPGAPAPHAEHSMRGVVQKTP
jgi:hypothetical protein